MLRFSSSSPEAAGPFSSSGELLTVIGPLFLTASNTSVNCHLTVQCPGHSLPCKNSRPLSASGPFYQRTLIMESRYLRLCLNTLANTKPSRYTCDRDCGLRRISCAISGQSLEPGCERRSLGRLQGGLLLRIMAPTLS